MSAGEKTLLVLMALAIGVAFGCAAYTATHLKPPTAVTAVDILLCRRTYGCNLDDLLRLPK